MSTLPPTSMLMLSLAPLIRGSEREEDGEGRWCVEGGTLVWSHILTWSK